MKINEGHLYDDIDYLKDRKEILAWLKQHANLSAAFVKIDSNWTVNIGKVNRLRIQGQFHKIPVKFGKVDGNFDCSNCGLHTLENVPVEIRGDFDCSENKLSSLEHGPRVVDGAYYCMMNRLTSLKGSPFVIQGDFNCSENELKSLEGCPDAIYGEMNIGSNYLKKIDAAPSYVEGIKFEFGHVTSLQGIENFKVIQGEIDYGESKITSHILGLVLIEGLAQSKGGKNQILIKLPVKVMAIMKKHMGKPDNLFQCQQELIEAGFEEYAQL